MDKTEIVNKIIRNKNLSLEQHHKEQIGKLKWEYADVLYSFRGVYTLGINVYYKDKVECCGLTIRPKKRTNDYQRVYSAKFIKENYSDFSELNNLGKLEDFIKVYNEIGNIIPIWPGGNMHKGMSQCYDIPDIYFNKSTIKRYSLHFFNSFKYKNSFLEEVLQGKYSKIETKGYLNFDKEEYKSFLVHIIKVIRYRTDCIEKWLKRK
ncbi:hypothetical protein PRVXT_000339 [Proteinivorax tanatarense]|uniref:Uncharacterized protein n=1 Tax=Proteinivorax tanatarense TaxID=1260629 RepID=A0AAU7VM95_9FIRM